VERGCAENLPSWDRLWRCNRRTSFKGKRDYAILSVLVGCGLRRAELVELQMEDFEQRDGRWLISDLSGKAGHVRTVPVPGWVKTAVDAWAQPAGINDGFVFRAVNKADQIWSDRVSTKAIWAIVRNRATASGLKNVAPHDLRRTCARLCRDAGGELDQIQFLLGHISVRTTERYLGCKQKLRDAVNDRILLDLHP